MFENIRTVATNPIEEILPVFLEEVRTRKNFVEGWEQFVIEMRTGTVKKVLLGLVEQWSSRELGGAEESCNVFIGRIECNASASDMSTVRWEVMRPKSA